jgi:FtsP/CotA-like multicopper oxidase with cupredoxin domain
MTRPHFPDLAVSRRKFLGLGAGALAAIGLGSSAHSTPFGSYFYEPEVRSSRNGFLVTTLRASTTTTVASGESLVSSVYEGAFPGPTLRVRPGDFLRVELINDLDEPTNLHVHGLHVSPQSPGDNVLLTIPAGERFVYEYVIAADHPAGTYFYHPHLHGLVTNQMFKGMAGLIVVEGDLDTLPGIAGLPERALVLQRPIIADGRIGSVGPNQKPNAGPGSAGTVLVNGAETPIMFIRPGETQRWRLLNASVSSLWQIQVERHPLTLIGQDGNPLARARTVDSLALATAQRRDVLIQGGRPGVYALTFQDLQGPFPPENLPPPVAFAYLVVTGAAMDPQPLPTTLLPFVDLRTLPVDQRRTITFEIIGNPAATTFAGQGFVIDGKAFDHNRIDQFARLGTTEEWRVANVTTVIHPFHIHINPYQVVAINDQPYDAPAYEDTTPVPAGGSITFRTRFLDYPGVWVYHCHILGHEDGGMMGMIQVVA